MFFNKTIDVHLYTKHKFIHEFAKPKTGLSTAPKWFQKLRTKKVNFIPESNLKACPAFPDYYKRVIQLPLWSDLALQVGPKGDASYQWQFSDGLSVIRTHPSTLLGNYRLDTEVQHFLIEGPWVVECNNPVSFMVCQPSWQNFEFPTLSTCQGVINLHKQFTLSSQIYITRTDETQNIFMEHGTPLLDLVPLTEKKIKVHTHFDVKKHAELISYTPRVKFTGGYNYKQAALKKCPYR